MDSFGGTESVAGHRAWRWLADGSARTPRDTNQEGRVWFRRRRSRACTTASGREGPGAMPCRGRSAEGGRPVGGIAAADVVDHDPASLSTKVSQLHRPEPPPFASAPFRRVVVGYS